MCCKKNINGKQITICWHVDDLLIGHADPAEVTHFLTWLAKRYDTADKKLNVVWGTKHDCLGMNMDFSPPSEVKFDMIPYIRKIISTFPKKVTGVQSTPAGNRLFQVRLITEAQFLTEDLARAFHHTTVQLLFLSCVRQDIQTTIAFLATRVKHLDADDWGKLRRVLKYLRTTFCLPLTLFADSSTNIAWYINALHQIHEDCEGHTRSILTFG